MDYLFPIALLIVATFLLLLGVVGRGASMGAEEFTLTVKGNVGKIPRVALLAASGVCLVLSIVMFAVVASTKMPTTPSSTPGLPHSDSSPSPQTPTPSPITVYIKSHIAPNATNEVDEIQLGHASPIRFSLTPDDPEGSGWFKSADKQPGESVNWTAVAVVTLNDGSQRRHTGSGSLVLRDGATYKITWGDNGTIHLESE